MVETRGISLRKCLTPCSASQNIENIMFLLPPVGGGETFETKKVYLIGTKNKFQFRSYLCLIHTYH